MGSSIAVLAEERRRRQRSGRKEEDLGPARASPPQAPLPQRARWLSALALGVALALGIAVLLVLHHQFERYRPADVLAHVRAIPPGTVALAALLTALSYLCLTRFDALGLRFVGQRVPAGRVALGSFIAYAFSHNVSLAAFTGSGIRYRFYAPLGLSVPRLGLLVAFCSTTTALGVLTLAGAALLFAPPASLPLVGAHVRASAAAGALLLAGPLAWLGWASFARRPLAWRNRSFAAPGWRIAVPQLLLGVLDLALAAAVLWVLLPPADRGPYVAFAGVYAAAVVAGILSNVPGGLGVFETALLLALPSVPRDELLGALIAYRGIYYFAPLALAALLFALHELHARREFATLALRLARLYWAPLAPQVGALLAFLAGAVLLFSGALPAVDARLHLLHRLVPLPLLELSHLAGSVVGLALLLLARGLQRRLAAAWQLSCWLLGLGMLASLLKGLDFEEALLLGAVLLALGTARAAFYRPSRLIDERFTGPWLAAVLGVVALSLFVGLLAADTHYSNDLWWTFATAADVPRTLRASLTVLLLAGMLLAWHLLRPGRVPPHAPAQLDLGRAGRALASSDDSLANAALTGDKRLLFDSGSDGFVMYQVMGRSWIALGDPVGPAERLAPLAWAFRERVDRADGRCIFYQVGAAHLPLYVDMGLTLSKLGEEARVALPGFGLEGPARAELRQAHRRALRSGSSFEIVPATGVAALLPRLQRISDQWLERKATAEKGFSVGAFDPDYLARLPLALVRVEGDPVAFANLWPSAARSELSVDLMRFGDSAPRGTMDYLLIELMLWGRDAGYRWFNLGMAPLAGLEPHSLAPAWHRMGRFVYRHGEHFYNFEGLKAYKQKFAPEWQPRYLATQGRLSLPRALFDASRLVAGGVRGIVAR
ncbi:MAG: bifunctional lysylphosphatidylglycerol flippase/synthetase MprF [Steroidobacteraceae bacterium]